jgi:hypothetical protein
VAEKLQFSVLLSPDLTKEEAEKERKEEAALQE